jgi:hypothetical protein
VGSGASFRASVPAVAGPGFADEAAGDDDCIGQGDERVDHRGAYLGADEQLLEASIVSRVSAFDHPAGTGLQRAPVCSGHRSAAGTGLQRGALPADGLVAAEDLKQGAGLAAVVARIQMHGDLLGKVEPEPRQLLQRGRQQW